MDDEVGDAKHDQMPTLTSSPENSGKAPVQNQASEASWTNIKAKDSTEENSERRSDELILIASADNDDSGSHGNDREEMEKGTPVEFKNSWAEAEPRAGPSTLTSVETASTSQETSPTAAVEGAASEMEPADIEETPRTEIVDDEGQCEDDEDDDDELLSEVLESCKNDSEVCVRNPSNGAKDANFVKVLLIKIIETESIDADAISNYN